MLRGVMGGKVARLGRRHITETNRLPLSLVFRYGLLGRMFPAQTTASVLQRLAMDQLVFAPSFIPIFFVQLQFLDGDFDTGKVITPQAGTLFLCCWNALADRQLVSMCGPTVSSHRSRRSSRQTTGTHWWATGCCGCRVSLYRVKHAQKMHRPADLASSAGIDPMAAQLINFRYIPGKYQVLYSNMVSNLQVKPSLSYAWHVIHSRSHVIVCLCIRSASSGTSTCKFAICTHSKVSI